MNNPKIVENLFFYGVTFVSVFTCIVRSDYNFALGLLCYYMIKNIDQKVATEQEKTCRTVSKHSRQLLQTRFKFERDLKYHILWSSVL